MPIIDYKIKIEKHSKLSDYFLLASVLVGTLLVSLVISYLVVQEADGYIRTFMGVFLLVFAGFKLLDLETFVRSFANFDLIAKQFLKYAYVFPLIEIFLGIGYFLNLSFINPVAIIILTISGVGIVQELVVGRKINDSRFYKHINIPLSTVILIEDVTMVAMALILSFGLFG